MVTKLQKLVDTIEDRHIGEYQGDSHSIINRQERGTVLNATPQEMSEIFKISIPMDKSDYKRRGKTGGTTPRWKEWSNGQISNRRKDA